MTFSAEDILMMSKPGELFSDDPDIMRKEYKELAKAWHPDLNDAVSEANEVMTKINLLYLQCVNSIKTGRWEKPGFIKLFDKAGKAYEIRYLNSESFELGTMYIANSIVFYLIDEFHKELADNAEAVIKNFTFADENMRIEASRYLPKLISRFETKGGQTGVVFEKSTDLLLLRDVLNYFKGRLPPRHAAWVLSSLLNTACYLDYAGLSHNSISIDTVFISPKHHSSALLGGWWYAVPQGRKMAGVPENIYSIMPNYVKAKGLGSILTDLEAIRLVGRELLGDRNGTRLADTGDIPVPMINFLRGTASPSALEDYSKWGRILKESFGQRRFIEMDLNSGMLYKK